MFTKTLTKKIFELIVVDNGSTNNSIEYIKSLNCKKIFNIENKGFAKAINQGIQIANPKNDVVLLNSDAFVQEKWLDYLYQTLKEKKLFNSEDTKVFNLVGYCMLF